MSESIFADSPTELQTRAHRKRADALAEYIRVAKEDIEVLDVNWDDSRWVGAGVFVKLGGARGVPKTTISSEKLMDLKFVEFAKAYIRERHHQNPGESRAQHIDRFAALRIVEAALVELHGTATVLEINRSVLDRAVVIAKNYFTGQTPYKAGRSLQLLVEVLTNRGVLPLELRSWTSPIPRHRNIGNTVGGAGDLARQAKLPNLDALEVLADIFNRDLDPTDQRYHRDIYTTSVAALLVCAPSRGQEIHRLPENLVFESTDRFGDQQTGLRLQASKGFGAYVKWVWSGMVPVAHKAIERLRAITEEPRALARHIEDHQVRDTFFRHSNCPGVSDDEPLTALQACLALGLRTLNPYSSLAAVSLSGALHVHTLSSLWKNWVLPRHAIANPHFPYISEKDKALGKKGGLKFSEALFCMRAGQIGTFATSSVTLWMPSLTTGFSKDVAPSREGKVPSIFDRYGYTDADGGTLKVASHQLRHLLNTEAQRAELPDEMIAHWSGRLRIKQNETYDNRPEQERVDQVRPVVEDMDARLALRLSTTEDEQVMQAGPWQIDIGPKPRSCSDLDDIQPRLAGIKTEYGECYHDWALAVCEGLVACLDCREHACIKGADQTSQERLERIERLHRQVLVEVAKAQVAVSQENWGAQEWLEMQQRYAAKLEQLIDILQSPDVPDQSVVRLADAQHPTHLHRVLRGIAVRALEDGSAPDQVMKQMLVAVSNTERGVQPITVHRPKPLSNPKTVESERPTHGT